MLWLSLLGALPLPRVLWKSAYSRSNMKPKSIPKQASEMDRGVVLLVSGASATIHVPVILHSFACIFLHFPFICMHSPFILHSCPVIFHSFSFHVPFICVHFPPFSFHIPFISFRSAFMFFHLPFICMHFPFFLDSRPFISFLKLWKWPYGLARGPSATNGYR